MDDGEEEASGNQRRSCRRDRQVGVRSRLISTNRGIYFLICLPCLIGKEGVSGEKLIIVALKNPSPLYFCYFPTLFTFFLGLF